MSTRLARGSIVLVAVILVSTLCVSSAPGRVVSLNFQAPLAVTFDEAGIMYVLEEQGQVLKVSINGAPALLATLGATATGDALLKHPSDLGVDAAGQVVVVDTGNRRLAVFTPAGDFVGPVPCALMPTRVVRAPDRSLYVLESGPDGPVVEHFSAEYQRLGTFNAFEACALRSRQAAPAALAVDPAGHIWVADWFGCGPNYRLRAYDSAGNVVGNWSRRAGQISDETIAAHHNMVSLVADVVAAGSNVFVILGAGGAETGGLEVDVWTTSGTFVRRARLVGPARSLVRGLVHGSELFVTDTRGTQEVIGVSLGSL